MSLRLRLFLSHAAVVMIGVGVLALSLLLLLRQVEVRRVQRQLGTAAALVTRFSRLSAPNDTPQRLANRLNNLAQDQRGRVLLLDANGEVTFDTSQKDKASMLGKTLPLSATIDTANAVPASSAVGEFRDGQNKRFAYAAVRTPANTSETATWFVLAQQQNGGPLLNVLDEISTPVFESVGIALIVAAIAAALIARSIAQPIQTVAASAKALAAGNYAERVNVNGPSEIKQLAADFNHMAGQVQGAQQAERDFVANVSHELKTPLTSIQGFAQAIRDGDVPDADSTKNAARIIFDEAERLRRLVGGLLDSARIESGEMRMAFASVQVNDIAQSCLDKLQPRAQQVGVALSASLAPNVPAITADGDRLAQVLTNLIDNSLKHTGDNGKVTVETKLVRRKDSGANMVEVSVADTGSGIPPEDLPHVFERFYQADKSRSTGVGISSAGLGLAIVKQIVEAHGGQIVAQSVPGLGTRMKSSLAKVLHKLQGRSIIAHVCRTATLLEPRGTYVIVGHQADDVRAAVEKELGNEQASFVTQSEQRGTGDAVMSARSALAQAKSTILILSGDVPLVRVETLRTLIEKHLVGKASCTMLSVRLENPTGYGRVVRNEAGNFVKIVEQKDGTEDERQIRLLFNELSDGQRCLICLYAILHFTVIRGGTVILEQKG